MKKLELYLHIPFCVRKCAYCDFLSAPAEYQKQKVYQQALLQEIRNFPQREAYEVSSVFFGGGTPSIFPAEWIREIMDVIRTKFHIDQDAEITIECNPGTADEEKLHAYKAMGINRISFGLQSANDTELQLLGRIHTWDTFLQTYQAAQKAGFSNINIDLMSALPGQTAASWCETVQKVLQLKPKHISAYSLIIEEGTPFYEKYAQDARKREEGEQPEFLPSEEEEREMYHLTKRLLLESGLQRYEISNYAAEGYECRHNMGYWDGTEYAGFGLGASSLLESGGAYYRIQNTADIEQYLQVHKASEGQNHEDFFAYQKSIGAEWIRLSEKDRMEEFMFLGLRMKKGVSEQRFEQRFQKKLRMVYGDVVQKQIEQGLLEEQEGYLSLTDFGMDVSNLVMAEYLLDE